MTPLTVADTEGLDAALIMFRAAPAKKTCSFVFVEGESDEKFWQGRIAEQHCCLVFVVSFQNNNKRQTGKAAVLKNIRTLNNSTIDGFLGIIDNDFDALACLPRENNVCVTDTHDLETLLLRSPIVFRKLLAEFGDSQLIVDFEITNATTVHAYLLELGLAFAKIEWLKQQLQPSLELKDLHKNDTILDRNIWRLFCANLEASIGAKGLASNSPAAQALLETLTHIDPWLLCNGHILLDLLSIGFQHVALGKKKTATSENLASFLRAAIDKEELYKTELCLAIFRWQDTHQPYAILTP